MREKECSGWKNIEKLISWGGGGCLLGTQEQVTNFVLKLLF